MQARGEKTSASHQGYRVNTNNNRSLSCEIMGNRIINGTTKKFDKKSTEFRWRDLRKIEIFHSLLGVRFDRKRRLLCGTIFREKMLPSSRFIAVWLVFCSLNVAICEKINVTERNYRIENGTVWSITTVRTSSTVAVARAMRKRDSGGTRKWISQLMSEARDEFDMHESVTAKCKNDFDAYKLHLQNQSVWAVRSEYNNEIISRVVRDCRLYTNERNRNGQSNKMKASSANLFFG